MLSRVGYEIEFNLPAETAMLAMLNVHPLDLLEPDEVRTEPRLLIANYFDSFGNRCTRFIAPAGKLRLFNSTLVLDSGEPDAVRLTARECPVEDLPEEVLTYLLNSRYCEVDRLSTVASELFANAAPGWARVQAIGDWVHQKVRFDYNAARPTNFALDVFTDRTGVCRDFQHRAVTFCRAMPPATSAILAFRRPPRWTSAPGSRSSSTIAGGPSTRATTRRVSAACSWLWAAMLPTSRSPHRSGELTFAASSLPRKRTAANPRQSPLPL